MIVLIAYGAGIRDGTALLAVAALIATTMPFGWWTELGANPKSLAEWTEPLWYRLIPWIIGHVPQLAAWIIILNQFYNNGWDVSQVPDFVHVIIWGELLFFFSFGFVCLGVQIAEPRHFAKGEIAFQTLSLVSKGVLGLILIVNVLMLSRFDDLYD